MTRCKDCVHSTALDNSPPEFQQHYKGYDDVGYCIMFNVAINLKAPRKCKERR